MIYPKWLRHTFLSLFLLFPCLTQAIEKNRERLLPLVEYLTHIAHQHQQDDAKPIPIFAIGGCSGVGKTYLTNLLVKLLQENNVRSISLPLDHFIRPFEERKKIGTEWDIRHVKAQELHDILSSISQGNKLVEKPTSDQMTGVRGWETINLSEIDLILHDGLYALCSEPPFNFFDHCFAGVFIEANESDISKWRWERELNKRQPRTEESFAKNLKANFEEFHRVIESSKRNAIFIIRKNSEHDYTELRF
jgi:uridine kinase